MKMSSTYGKQYALLISVGQYQNMGIINLPTYLMDLSLIETGLTRGLRFNTDNIRQMGANGEVTATELAMALKHFSAMLKEDDTFVFYFSGHGRNDEILLSDAALKLHSVLNYVDKFACRNKIVILDCCYSGDFKTAGPKTMSFDDTVKSFAGQGIAIMASSAADEKSRLGEGNNHSLFSGIVGTAMMSKTHVRKGLLSLEDINEEIFAIIKTWNEKRPNKRQNPIFRSCIGGTIFFEVEEYHPYVQKRVCHENAEYIVSSVEPLHAPNIKRLCAFVILKKPMTDTELAKITREIAEKIKYEEVYSTIQSELRFKGQPARAVWCYFGMDSSDLIKHNHKGYTIWTADQEMERLYYRDNKNAEVVDGIYIFKNTSYEMIKKMQEPTVTREEFIQENKRFLALNATMAEKFIYDLHEVANKTIDLSVFKKEYRDWIHDVQKFYIKFSEIDVAPDDLYDWSNEILNLAGWVLDISILIEKSIGERELWLINNAIRKYAISLERLRKLEEEIE